MLDKGWLVVVCVAAALVVAVVFLARTPRIFQAHAVVQVEQEDAKVVKAEQVVSEDLRGLETMNTVAQKMANPALIEEVLDANHLLPAGGNSATREEALSRYSRNVKATLRRNTRLIDLTVRDADPQVAATVANGLIARYLEEDAKGQQATTKSANLFLQEEAARFKRRLEASEQALEDYRREAGTVSLQQSQDIITPQLLDLSKRLTESKAAVTQAEGALNDSLKMTTNIEELLAVPEIAADADVVQTAADLAKSQNEFALVRQRYREKHPKYILASSSLNALSERLEAVTLKARARLQQELRVAYQKALTNERGLQQELDEAGTKAMELGASAVRFNVLSREVESDRALYDSVIGRLGETTLAAQIIPERIRVIQPAEAPARPSAPKPLLIVALALFAGLTMGLVSIFLWDSMDMSFRTADEVEELLALPVLGAVHRLPRAKGSRNVLSTSKNGDSRGGEVFRSLRASLSMLGREKNRRTFLFTSALLSEGKTFTSINFAVSLAQQGLRTLLVDADLRRPMVEETFAGQNKSLPGLTDFLLGRKKLNEVCRPHDQIPNLFWLGSGSPVSNPGELLAGSDFRGLLNEALAYYDRIVIDTAPLLPVSDTLLIASTVQTSILVVQGCKTSRKGVERSVRMLRDAEARVAGVVLNLLPRRILSGYFYSYYSASGYETYGEKKTVKTAAVS
jgi:capsular exopolysaccharide synthesis family protein